MGRIDNHQKKVVTPKREYQRDRGRFRRGKELLRKQEVDGSRRHPSPIPPKAT